MSKYACLSYRATLAALALALAASGCKKSTPAQSDTPEASSQTEPKAEAKTEPKTEPEAKTEPQAAEDAPVDARAIAYAKDRSEEDLEADDRRFPIETLKLLDLRQGMKVADIGAGPGYTTELLARAVGPKGVVYAQNSKKVSVEFAEPALTERMRKPVMANVVSVVREFDDPLPPEARDLDRVIDVLFYHDFVWMKVDLDKHNKAIFDALKPGGYYVIIDHSAAKGRGVKDVETLHRIEESVVKEQVARAGFVLVEEADFMRNPNDKRDWNSLPWENEDRDDFSDRFVLKFQKPVAPQP